MSSSTAERSRRVEARPETIAARDGYALHAITYLPPGEPERVVLVTAAMGLKQAFYEPFARYLARGGCAVITFDYRGMGRSLKTPIQHERARLRDWGDKDYPAVIDHAVARFPGKKIQVVGHSIGGQLVGMLDNAHHLSAVCTVGAMHGYWLRFPWRQAVAFGVLWHVVVPIVARYYGYFPSDKLKRFNLGENLPEGVVLEWARFARSRHYMIAKDGAPLRAGFDSYRGPVCAYSFADDLRAPESRVRALHAYYKQAKVEYRHVDPKARQMPEVGHVGFFLSKHKDTLWRETLEWLRAH